MGNGATTKGKVEGLNSLDSYEYNGIPVENYHRDEKSNNLQPQDDQKSKDPDTTDMKHANNNNSPFQKVEGMRADELGTKNVTKPKKFQPKAPLQDQKGKLLETSSALFMFRHC